jgi:hypothetical protein
MEPSRTVSRKFSQNLFPMRLPSYQSLPQRIQQFLRLAYVMTIFAQPFDQKHLTRDAPFPFGDVKVCLGKVSSLDDGIGHSRARACFKNPGV